MQNASLFIRSRFACQNRSVARKKSALLRPSTPRRGTLAGPAVIANRLKTGIAELDSAFSNCPRAEIEDLQENILVSVERFKESLSLDNMSSLETGVAAMNELATALQGTLTAEVGICEAETRG